MVSCFRFLPLTPVIALQSRFQLQTIGKDNFTEKFIVQSIIEFKTHTGPPCILVPLYAVVEGSILNLLWR